MAEWLAATDPAIDLGDRLKLDSLQSGRRFQFRLRANPCVTRNHKRLGLHRPVEQELWLARKGGLHGFDMPALKPTAKSHETRFDVRISQEQMLRGNQHAGNEIKVYSVLFDGFLTVTEPERFRLALGTGIGHGKALGLGLLSVVPLA